MIRIRQGAMRVLGQAAGWGAAVAIALSAGTAAADSSSATRQPSGMDTTKEIGVSTASVLGSLVYGPVKMTYSTLGLVFGGIAYGLSGGDNAVFDAVATPAIYGDYLVLPAHIRGERGIEFIGRDPNYRVQEVVDTTVVEEVY